MQKIMIFKIILAKQTMLLIYSQRLKMPIWGGKFI